MINNENPFCKNDAESIHSRYWYNRLFDYVLSMYHFTGEQFDTGELNERYLNATLILKGYACFFNHNGKLRALDCSAIGFDVYREPTKVLVSNPTFKKGIYLIPDVNCVLMKNNKLGVPSFEIIKYYASLLGKLQTTLRVDLSNARLTKIFTADSDPKAQQLRKMLDDIDKGVHGAIIKNNVFEDVLKGGNNQPLCYSTPQEYIVDKYLADTKTILNEFFSTFGINSSGANMQKGERNLQSEVHSNDEQINVALGYYLEPREEALQRVNKKFNTVLKVEVRRSDADVSAESNGSSGDFPKPEM